MELSPTSTTFVRDRFTWLAYFMLGYYAYLQASLGPLMPFLRDELSLSYTLAGLHLSAFALGMVLAGWYGAAVSLRVGRRAIFWGGGGGMALGALALITGGHIAITVGSSFAMGASGSLLLVAIQASLTDHHGSRRAIALTEANIVASVFAALAPLLVGLGQSAGIGWRSALVVGTAFWLLTFLSRRGTALPPRRQYPHRATTGRSSRLPRAYWAYWAVIFIAVAIEWCMIFWAADFLENVVGLRRETSSALLSVFLGAMIVGRVIGSRLTHTISSRRLLPYAVGAVVVGFPLFWLGPVAIINIAGLFIAGLGVANLFPLTLSTAVTVAAELPDAASARISMAAGLAILIVPQTLGSLADQIGIGSAYGVVVLLLLAMVVALILANRLSADPA
jgi:fucose permease